MSKRRKDESKARVQRLHAARRAAGLVQVRPWIPDTPAARLALKNFARDLRIAHAVGDTGAAGEEVEDGSPRPAARAIE